MPKRIPVEPYQRNCYRCSNLTRTHYVENGVYEGAVSYGCPFSKEGEPVVPCKIDGCKKYSYGTPTEVWQEYEKRK